MTNREVMKIAIDRYKDMQLIVAIEELSELQKELTKALRNINNNKTINLENLVEEIADVEIMIEQIKMIFRIDDLEVKNVIQRKVNRLLNKLEESNNE